MGHDIKWDSWCWLWASHCDKSQRTFKFIEIFNNESRILGLVKWHEDRSWGFLSLGGCRSHSTRAGDVPRWSSPQIGPLSFALTAAIWRIDETLLKLRRVPNEQIGVCLGYLRRARMFWVYNSVTSELWNPSSLDIHYVSSARVLWFGYIFNLFPLPAEVLVALSDRERL